MKAHYGQDFVPRIAKTKRAARTKYERKRIQKLIKVGRRMERHTANQELKKFTTPS
jgi:hypothetical protein